MRGFYLSFLLDLLTALGLSLFYHRALISVGMGSHLIDHFDHRSFIWALEWLNHSTFGTGSLRSILDTNIFFPNTGTLAWSELLLGFIPLYGGIRLFVSNPVLALNLSAFVLTLSSCLAMLRLGRLVSGRFAPVAPIIASIGLISAGQEGHLHMKTVGLFMWVLLALMNFIRTRRTSYLLAAIVLFTWLFHCSVVQSLVTVYLGFFLLIAFGLIYPKDVFDLVKTGLRALFRPASLAILLAIALPTLFATMSYLKAKTVQGLFSLDEAVVYSGRIWSLFDPPSSSLIHPARYSDWGSHEAKLMAGYTTYFFVLLALFIPPLKQELKIKARAITPFLAIMAVICFTLALGPYEKISFASGLRIPLPGWVFWSYLPGFSVLRVAGRFGLLAAIFAGLLADLGLKRFLETTTLRSPFGKNALAAFVVVTFLFEQTTVFSPYPVTLVKNQEFYEELNKQTPKDASLVELPLVVPGHFETASYFIEQELASTSHWRRLFIGYSSKSSPEIPVAVQLWTGVAAVGVPAKPLFDYFASLGISHVVLDRSLLTPEQLERFRAELTARTGLGAVFERDSKELWKLDGKK